VAGGGTAYKVRLEYFEMVGGASVGFGVASTEASAGRATKALAASADAVILCVGFNDTSEGEGSDRTFRLPAGQDSLIRAISSVNKNTIVVLTSGSGVDMNEWIGQVPALVETWYSGQEGGTALAQILFGDENPAGKLPATFERYWEDNSTFHSYYPAKGEKRVSYSEGVFVGYRHFDRASVKPLFAFGYGLSYTTFQYANLSVKPARGPINEPVTVSFDLKNTGSWEGAEVAELYVGAIHPSLPRPIKELKGFVRVSLKPGETRRVSIMLDRRSFAFYDVSRKDWKAEKEDYSVLIGASSEDIGLRGNFSLVSRD